jgi:hypothetical protein
MGKGISPTNTQRSVEGKELPVRSVKKISGRHFFEKTQKTIPDSQSL